MLASHGHEVSTILTDCCGGARNRAKNAQTRHMEPFLVHDVLRFIAMDILSQLEKTTNGYPFVVIMINRYSKLTQALKTLNTSLIRISSMFCDNLIVPYRIPS